MDDSLTQQQQNYNMQANLQYFQQLQQQHINQNYINSQSSFMNSNMHQLPPPPPPPPVPPATMLLPPPPQYVDNPNIFQVSSSINNKSDSYLNSLQFSAHPFNQLKPPSVPLQQPSTILLQASQQQPQFDNYVYQNVSNQQQQQQQLNQQTNIANSFNYSNHYSNFNSVQMEVAHANTIASLYPNSQLNGDYCYLNRNFNNNNYNLTGYNGNKINNSTNLYQNYFLANQQSGSLNSKNSKTQQANEMIVEANNNRNLVNQNCLTSKNASQLNNIKKDTVKNIEIDDIKNFIKTMDQETNNNFNDVIQLNSLNEYDSLTGVNLNNIPAGLNVNSDKEDLNDLMNTSNLGVKRNNSCLISASALPKYIKPKICKSPIVIHLVKSKKVLKPNLQMAISPPNPEFLIKTPTIKSFMCPHPPSPLIESVLSNKLEEMSPKTQLMPNFKHLNKNYSQQIKDDQIFNPESVDNELSTLQETSPSITPLFFSNSTLFNGQIHYSESPLNLPAPPPPLLPPPPPPPPTSQPPLPPSTVASILMPPEQRPISPPNIPPPILRNQNYFAAHSNSISNQANKLQLDTFPINFQNKTSSLINNSLLNSVLNNSLNSDRKNNSINNQFNLDYDTSFNSSFNILNNSTSSSTYTTNNNSVFNNTNASYTSTNNNYNALLVSPNLFTLFDRKKPPPPYPGKQTNVNSNSQDIIMETDELQPKQNNLNVKLSNSNVNLINNQKVSEQDNSLSSSSAQSSAVSYCSPQAFKFFMEQHAENILKHHKAREYRRYQLESEMTKVDLPPSLKDQMRKLLRQKETNYLRLRRAKMNKSMFEHIKVIGVGAFGEVNLVRKRDDLQRLYAMKILHKSDVFNRNQAAHVKAERDILAEADNEWVVKLYYSFQDEENLYFVMDYVPGGDLMNLLIKFQVFSEELSKFYIGELTCAIESVHNLGFIHRDIKPDNILIDKYGHIKLTDFGLCTGFHWTHNSKYYRIDDAYNRILERKLSNANNLSNIKGNQRLMAHSLVGTPNYIAPEILSRKGYTKSCDWWSVGVILFEMLVGEPPFRDETALGTQAKVINWKQTLKIPTECKLSDEAKDLIFKLCTDAETRYGSDEIKVHSFFKNFDFGPNMRSSKAPYIPVIKYPTDTSNFEPIDNFALAERKARLDEMHNNYHQMQQKRNELRENNNLYSNENHKINHFDNENRNIKVANSYNYTKNPMLYEFTFRRFFDEAYSSDNFFRLNEDSNSLNSFINNVCATNKTSPHNRLEKENDSDNHLDEINDVKSIPISPSLTLMMASVTTSSNTPPVCESIINEKNILNTKETNQNLDQDSNKCSTFNFQNSEQTAKIFSHDSVSVSNLNSGLNNINNIKHQNLTNNYQILKLTSINTNDNFSKINSNLNNSQISLKENLNNSSNLNNADNQPAIFV